MASLDFTYTPKDEDIIKMKVSVYHEAKRTMEARHLKETEALETEFRAIQQNCPHSNITSCFGLNMCLDCGAILEPRKSWEKDMGYDE